MTLFRRAKTPVRKNAVIESAVLAGKILGVPAVWWRRFPTCTRRDLIRPISFHTLLICKLHGGS